MPTQIQWRRGTTAQTSSFTGASAEITVDITKNTVVVHDGVTPGGYPLALESAITNDAIYTQAAFNEANLAYVTANAAFAAANNVIPQIQPAYDTANSAFSKANVAYDTANSAFAAANNVAPQIQPAFNQANTAYELANSAFAKANTNYLSPNFPTFPLGLITDTVFNGFGEHVGGLIYDMKLVPDGSVLIVDAGSI